MKSEPALSDRVREYLARQWVLIACLTSIGVVSLAAGLLLTGRGSIQQGLVFSFATGVLSAIVIAFVSDFMSKSFLYDVLRGFEISAHEGGLIHASHREIPSRTEAIERFLSSGQTARIATFTADNYLQDEAVLELLSARLKRGCRVHILLFTPIYHLRSYVDRVKGGGELGKRHLSALELIRQQSLLFKRIETLQTTFASAFEVRFSPVQFHTHTAIWGNRRIYSSLIVRGVDGQDSPCIEVFPGLRNSLLFETFCRDFDYIWSRRDLTFSVAEMKPLYRRVLEKYPLDVDLTQIDERFAAEIENEAASIARSR